MKNLIPALLLIPMAACQNSTQKKLPENVSIAKYISAKPGTVLAADSMKIPDPLNDLYFSVKLLASEHSAKGTYDLLVRYGFNDASTQITLPAGGEKTIKPAIRKGDESFSYIIGFFYGDDPAFYDYYLVSAQKGQTKMKYLKAYSFQ